MVWSFNQQVEFFKLGYYEFIRLPDPKTGDLIKFTPKQIEALELLRDKQTFQVGYGGAARGGKTLLLCAFVILMAYAYPGIRWLIGRKELINLTQTTIKTFINLANKCGIGKVKSLSDLTNHNYHENGISHVLTFGNKSEVLFIKTKLEPSDKKDELARFGSLEITGACIDESNETDLKVIEVIGTRVGNWLNDKYDIKPKVFEVFNPSKNHVKSRYWIPYRDRIVNKLRKFVRALPTDNPAKEVRDYVKMQTDLYNNGLLSESQFQRLIKGNFDFSDDPMSLLDTDKIIDLWTNEVPTGNKYITTDIALRGSDLFTVGVWDGWNLIDISTMEKSGGKQILDLILKKKKQYSVPNSNITYDSDGVGGFLGGEGGFISNSIPFVNASKPIEEKMIDGSKEVPKFEHLKTQCIIRTAEKIQSGGVRICETEHKEKIKQELGWWKRHKPHDIKLTRTLPKSEIVDGLGRSPDFADMIMMRYRFELKNVITFEIENNPDFWNNN